MRRIFAIFLILLTLFLSSCAEKTLPVPKTEDSGKEKSVEAEKENLSSETETASESEKISTSSTTVTTTTKAPTTTTKAPTTTTQAPVVTTKAVEPPLKLVFPTIISNSDVLVYKKSASSKLENTIYLGVSKRMDFCREFIAVFNAGSFNEKYMIPKGYEMKIAYAGEENPKYPEMSSGLRFIYYVKFDYTQGQKEQMKTEFDQWIKENEEEFYGILKTINSEFPKPEHKIAFLTVWFLTDGGTESLVKKNFWDDSYVSAIVEPYA